MPYPTDYKYTKEHEWIKADGNNATIGITHHAQESLGDIVFVDLPKVGSEITSGKSLRLGRVGKGRLRPLRACLGYGDRTQPRPGNGAGKDQ